jgi:hypothetical protein
MAESCGESMRADSATSAPRIYTRSLEWFAGLQRLAGKETPIRHTHRKAGFLKQLGVCCLGFGLLHAAHAGDAASAPLTLVRVYDNGVVLVWTPGTRTGTPTCATEYSRFALDSTTAGGRSLLAILLAAHSAGRSVALRGTGACTLYGDTENLQFVDEGTM